MVKFDDDNNVIAEQKFSAIIVGVRTNEDIDYSMRELESLVEAAGGTVAGEIMQNMDRPNTATYIGSGKVEELADIVGKLSIDTVVFNNELSGAQIRNLEDAVAAKVIDRTILILDIFASRAISKEGKLQVELAQYKYRLPRLTGFGKSLSRLGGGVGTRGPGEKKMELDRRHIESRVLDIKKELEVINKTRELQRNGRKKSEIPSVALVGYTNVGKSAIMNHIMSLLEKDDKKVEEKDMLFATLDAKHRAVEFDNNYKFILIDTVGFVSKLPHTLVSAFKSTLEEVKYADLILHVVDYSNPEYEFQEEVTDKVLSEIGAGDVPILKVYNKIDATDREVPQNTDNTLFISAKQGIGISSVMDAVKSRIFDTLVIVDLIIPYDKGKILSRICNEGNVKSMDYLDIGTAVTVELKSKDFARVKEYAIV